MKKIKICSFLLIFSIIISCLSVGFADDMDKQWATLATSVDQNGNVVTTKIFGYYTDVDNFGQVFVVCDPNTGQETGDAYIPNVKIGDKSVQEIIGYDKGQKLDLYNLKQINPINVSVIAPNIPTSVGWDEDALQQDQYIKKITSTLVFPGSFPDDLYINANLPDYSLIVAQVQNPNSFPVTGHVRINFYGKDYDFSVSLGSNETKYILLNAGNNGFDAFTDSFFNYYTYIKSVETPDFPSFLTESDGTRVFFKLYNPDPTQYSVRPSYPLKLCYWFDFGVHAVVNSSLFFVGSIEGRAHYNFETKQWELLYFKVYPGQFGALSKEQAKIIALKEFNSWGLSLPYPINSERNGIEVYIGEVWDEDNDYVGKFSLHINNLCPVVGDWMPTSTDNATSMFATDDASTLPSFERINQKTNYHDIIEIHPMYIDQYRFIPVDGNIGYLQKYTINGYYIVESFLVDTGKKKSNGKRIYQRKHIYIISTSSPK